MKIKRFVLPDSRTTLHDRLRRLLSYIWACLPIGYLLVGLHTLLHRRRTYRYEVSLCMIFKNEAPYLREWLEYHILLGVDHFYLYNNNSDDDFAEVLSPYIREGRVTLVDWERNYCQVGAYEHCYKASREETRWLGFIDADEFLNLSFEAGDAKTFFAKYEAWPSLFLFWRMFGTSGVMTEDYSKPVIEQFTSCWPDLCNEGKSFINNDYRFTALNIHWSRAEYLGLPLFGVAVNRVFVPYMNVIFRRINPRACINHYWSKSREFALFKTYVRSDCVSRELEETRKRNGADIFELQCTTKDFSIQRWLVMLKEILSSE